MARVQCANCGFVFEVGKKQVCPKCGSNALDPYPKDIKVIWR